MIKINNELNIAISEKNSKLGLIASFSIPAGKKYYCSKNCKSCYMKSLQGYRKNVFDSYLENYNTLEAIKKEKDRKILNTVIDKITMYIKYNCIDIFRFNIAGDIDNNYMNLIVNIAKNNNDTIFYMYTKNFSILECYVNDIPKNLIINISIMHYSDIYLINKYFNNKNIKFFITYHENNESKIKEFLTKNNNLFDFCDNDINKELKCIGCKKCFDMNKPRIILNKYRNNNVKEQKVDYKIYSKICNYFKTITRNEYVLNLLKEAILVIMLYSDVSYNELSNIFKLRKVYFKNIADNMKKHAGLTKIKKCNNNINIDITLNRYYFNKYLELTVLIHELIHVLTYDEKQKHGKRWCDIAKQITNKTIYNISEIITIKNYNCFTDSKKEYEIKKICNDIFTTNHNTSVLTRSNIATKTINMLSDYDINNIVDIQSFVLHYMLKLINEH